MDATRRLWAASALSATATWATQVGVFVQVLRGHPASSLAVVELVGTVPALLALPFAGAWADRWDPRRTALLSMVLQAVLLIGLAGALRGGLWLVSVLYSAQAVANTTWPPARQRVVLGAVPAPRRAAANAAIGSVGGVTTIVGAAGGGALSAWSPALALGAAALVQALAVLPLLAVRATAVPVTHARGSIVEGLRAVRALPLARSVIWIGIAWGCIGGAYSVLLAAHVTKDLHHGGVALGLLYAVDGVAVLVGAAVATRLIPQQRLRAYAVGYVVQGAAWAAVFAFGGLVAAGIALAPMRLASGVIVALDTTILLATVPPELHGRVTSLHMSTYGAMSRVSLAVFGALLTVTTPRMLGVVAGVLSVLIGLAWAARRERRRVVGCRSTGQATNH